MTGSVPGLGNWAIEDGIEMTWGQDDWWMCEYHCEGLFTVQQQRNSFKLDPAFGLKLDGNEINQINNNNNLNNNNHNNSIGHNNISFQKPYKQQSLSPILKGVSPQFIDLEYKYVLFENYGNTWEPERNHKISLMVWCGSVDADLSPYEDEIFIEIRDEWSGGNGICPTLDFQASHPSSSSQLVCNSSSIINSQPTNGSSSNSTSHSTSNSNGGSLNSSSSSIPNLHNHSHYNISGCGNDNVFCDNNNNNDSLLGLNNSYFDNASTSKVPANSYQFLHPLDPHPVPFYPNQICTFIVADEGNADAHSVLLVSHFFGSDLNQSIQMIPITQVGVPYTLWIGQLYSPLPIKFEYKYVVMSNNNAGIYWEKGSRFFSPSIHGPRLLVNNDGALRVSDASQSWMRTGLVGLTEYDNNCSLLSVVQLLYHIIPLKNILLKLRGRIGFPFTQCLANIFTSMEMGSQTTDINPLQNRIGQCSDSAEILNIVLNSLIEEISRISTISNYDQDICINQIFEGELSQTSMYLDNLGNIETVKTHNEKFVNIILPVRGFNSLEESLKYYKHTTEHFDSNTYETITSFESMPDIFIIQLDRTDYNQEQQRTVKLSNRFSFPKKFVPLNQSAYRIKGIVCHTGSAESYDPFTGGGHYFLFIRRKKQWYKCDGPQISIVSQKEAYYNSFGGVDNQQAYILIYEKVDDN